MSTQDILNSLSGFDTAKSHALVAEIGRAHV